MGFRLFVFMVILPLAFTAPDPDPENVAVNVEININMNEKSALGIGGENLDTISFEEYISKYSLEFEDEAEKLRRKRIFLDTVEKIKDHNRLYNAGITSYKMGLNQFSYLTDDEFVSQYTGLNASVAVRGQRTYYKPIDPGNKPPPSVNWVHKGMVTTPVGNQGSCLSCWAFAAACVIESQIAIEKGILQKLSEQYLVDCDPEYITCKRGYHYINAINFVIEKGIALASVYPYTSGTTDKKGTCKASATKTPFTVVSQEFIKPGSDADLLNANIHIGPIAVAIYHPPSLRHYAQGIFDDNFCNNDKPVNHAMVLTGYGEKDNQKYWTLRNSWGANWGQDGYVDISRDKPNNCWISSQAVFPILKKGCSKGAVSIGGQCLRFSADKVSSWSDAKKNCVLKGGLLASLKNPKAVMEYARATYPGVGFWAGGFIPKCTSNPQTEQWTWLNGDPFPEDFPWSGPACTYGQQPDCLGGYQTCLVANWYCTGYYDDQNCDYNPHPYICEE